MRQFYIDDRQCSSKIQDDYNCLLKKRQLIKSCGEADSREWRRNINNY